MEIKVKYWSNHGKAHYIDFESFDDYIAKYKEDPKLGTFFASGIEAKFGNCDKYTNFKTFKNLFDYCCDAKIQRKNREKTLKSCLTVGDLIEELKKYDKDTKILTIANREKAYQSFEEVTKIKEENVKFAYDEILEIKSIVF